MFSLGQQICYEQYAAVLRHCTNNFKPRL